MHKLVITVIFAHKKLLRHSPRPAPHQRCARFSTTTLRFAATGAFQITAASEWKSVAGVLGLVLCALAIAAALRLELTVDEAT